MARSTASASRTSAGEKVASSPSLAATSSPGDVGRSMIVTATPRSIRAVAVASPRPEAPPVTTAELSVRSTWFPFRSYQAGRLCRLSVEPLDDGGVRHAAGLAHRLQPVAAAGLLEVVEQGRHEPGAGGAQRVAEGDRAAPRVELRVLDPELGLPGQRYGGEGLVDLERVDLVDGHSGAGERLHSGRDGAGE